LAKIYVLDVDELGNHALLIPLHSFN